ncbi:hypothetical protein, partial [uncultured Kingella sp.]|uniref:hypothetical protein n=1 Tax=uncultured Kingella sp. TaxID=159270 RepID=UPI0025936635
GYAVHTAAASHALNVESSCCHDLSFQRGLESAQYNGLPRGKVKGSLKKIISGCLDCVRII